MKMMLVMALMSLGLCSCAVQNTAQTRISKNGSMYSKMSPEHRSLVASGQIAEGMSQDAVYLAWGSPSKIYKLEEDGQSKERWVYTRNQSQPTNTVGIGYARYSRYSRWGYDGGIGYGYPHRNYISETIGMVVFTKGKVESWERMK